jgi:lipid-A-disaccharide synthase
MTHFVKQTSNTTIWIVAGEKSGDLYGARLARSLQEIDSTVVIRGMGGHEMSAAGVDLMVDSTDLAVMGLVEVLKHLKTFRAVFASLLARAKAERPDAVVLIDYPGFNLRFAKQLKRLGIKVVYYISPQVWAWGKRRIPKIASWVDKMLAIYPFEPAVYAETDLDVEFVGHPLVEILADYRGRPEGRERDTVLLLPGSRQNEIKSLLPVMLQTAAKLQGERPGLRFVLATPPGSVSDKVRAMLEELQKDMPAPAKVELVEGQTHAWMARATAGIAASGTVTMEAAIMGLPLVVAYRLNPLTYLMARMLVRLPYFTITNLVANRLVFAEYLQGQVTPENLSRALKEILPGGRRCREVQAGMEATVKALGAETAVCQRAAAAVWKVANPENGPA